MYCYVSLSQQVRIICLRYKICKISRWDFNYMAFVMKGKLYANSVSCFFGLENGMTMPILLIFFFWCRQMVPMYYYCYWKSSLFFMQYLITHFSDFQLACLGSFFLHESVFFLSGLPFIFFERAGWLSKYKIQVSLYWLMVYC